MAITVVNVTDGTLKGTVTGPTFTGNVDGAKFTGSVTHDVTTPPPNQNIPVISSTEFAIAGSPPLDTLVGKVIASNSPTAYAITDGNASGYFAIYSSANLRTSETVKAVDGVYPLKVTASNASGTSAPQTITVTIGTGAVVDPPPVDGGGAYNNLTNWPSATNRPSISGSVLTWIGPVGGGPSTANDKVQTRTLTPRSGNFATSSNNQIIEGLDISGGYLSIKHTGVIVRQCRIRSTGNSTCVIESSGSPTVEDCIFTNNGGTQQNGINVGWTNTMSSKQSVLRRCNIFGFENHFPSQVNVLVIDNWFHGAVGSDCDMLELYGNPPDGGSQGIVARHNTFDGTDTKSGSFLNAGINVTNDFGGWTKNHTFDNNAFIKIGSSHDICDDKSHSNGVCSFAATNNGFYQSGGYRRDQVTCSPNSGNFVMATPTATSGTLCNGTGAI